MTEKQKEGLSVYNNYYNRDYKLETDQDYENMYGVMTTRSHIAGSGQAHNTLNEKKGAILEMLVWYANNERFKIK